MPENSTQQSQYYKEVIQTYLYASIWIVLSAGVILYNKYILSSYGFPYPVALTMWHMAFCSVIAFILIKAKFVESIEMNKNTYLKCVVPIAACFSVVLILSNSAYIYLSVAFIQMLKALMPVTVYSVGLVMRNETYSLQTVITMIVITIGVILASYGELNFVLIGVLMQLGAVCSEAVRLSLVQVFLQKQGIKLNPITSLYYISPACLVFLTPVFLYWEYPKMINDPELKINPLIMLSNATLALALNLAVFLLIGKTSALTMNVAGVVKDWVLIGLSGLMFKQPTTRFQLIGYSIAFVGVWYYNQQRLAAIKNKHANAQLQAQDKQSKGTDIKNDVEKQPLILSKSQENINKNSRD